MLYWASTYTQWPFISQVNGSAFVCSFACLIVTFWPAVHEVCSNKVRHFNSKMKVFLLVFVSREPVPPCKFIHKSRSDTETNKLSRQRLKPCHSVSITLKIGQAYVVLLCCVAGPIELLYVVEPVMLVYVAEQILKCYVTRPVKLCWVAGSAMLCCVAEPVMVCCVAEPVTLCCVDEPAMLCCVAEPVMFCCVAEPVIVCCVAEPVRLC